jgi:type I restriction enzyme R subunit
MMGLIDEMKDGQKRFGPGYFDLVVIDEAHRSVYKKFGAIFEYFDSLLVGLTATPKDEVDHNTYRLFELENGIPTDEYPLDEAVRDKWLVPSLSVSVPLKFVREGIVYDELSDAEKEEWDELEWGEDTEAPDRVTSEAVNRWLFNEDTVDKVLEYLMTKGHAVAGGDRLGKTIIFAKNHAHAEFIAKRFDANYPHHAGHFARVIDFKVEYAQSLIDDFSMKDKAPHIAISVDMLDTGIDVPEVANLVFFKLVRSKTKFWQMVGRGTRLCPDLFGPGKDKKNFYIFDFCGNLEFFRQKVPTTDGGNAPGLNERLFGQRVELIAELDGALARQPDGEIAGLRAATASLLRAQVTAMPLDNFLVRAKRRLVERYSDQGVWDHLGVAEQGELVRDVAALPSALMDSDQDAKQFDLILLALQLTVLRVEPRFEELKKAVIAIASALMEKQAIPMVRDQMLLIEEVQTDQFWEAITVPELEQVRLRLRALVKFIEKSRREPVYTNFEDELRASEYIALPGISTGVDAERFREKALAFLRDKLEEPALHKVRWNEPLTFVDLEALEQMLVQAGIGTIEEIEKIAQEEHGLGLFIRSIVGLDRAAAKRAFSRFIEERQLNASQLDFVNLIIDHLTQCGWMRPKQLFESPFKEDFAAGPQTVFPDDESIQALLSTLTAIEQNALGNI